MTGCKIIFMQILEKRFFLLPCFVLGFVCRVKFADLITTFCIIFLLFKWTNLSFQCNLYVLLHKSNWLWYPILLTKVRIAKLYSRSRIVFVIFLRQTKLVYSILGADTLPIDNAGCVVVYERQGSRVLKRNTIVIFDQTY